MNKNLFELKNARRVVIEENVFENNWQDDQNGFAILFTVRNQNGGAPWSVIRDVLFTRNWIKRVAAGVNIMGEDDARGRTSDYTTNIIIRHNLFEDVTNAADARLTNPDNSNTAAGRLFHVSNETRYVTIDQNTGIQTRATIFAWNRPNQNFRFTNNMVRHNPTAGSCEGSNNCGIAGVGKNPGTAAITEYFPGMVLQNNVLLDNAVFQNQGVWQGVWQYPGDNNYTNVVQGTHQAPHVIFVQSDDPAAGSYKWSLANVSDNDAWRGLGADVNGIRAALVAGPQPVVQR